MEGKEADGSQIHLEEDHFPEKREATCTNTQTQAIMTRIVSTRSLILSKRDIVRYLNVRNNAYFWTRQ